MSLLLFATTNAAQEQDIWSIVPSTCIVDKSGDFCRLNVLVTPPSNYAQTWNNREICFALQQQTLHCLPTVQLHMQVNVEFDRPSMFEVLLEDTVVAAQLLEIQTLSPVKQRRRVRSPWSLF